MQRIELDNFRVFGAPASFDLAPVTVLTGKNNSGKSSLIKAFLVLADYLTQVAEYRQSRKMRWSSETGENWVLNSQLHGKSLFLQTAAL